MAAALSFRDDINGLRAWAVLAVVLFHFDVPGFAGGFIGVDVFFVISGYLMMRIIVTGLAQRRFSFLRFCMARAVRIVPALLVLCMALLALGYFALTPPDYRELATHVVNSTTFTSNIKYWGEAGYFDASSHEKWLLHTWSLSVEWQFYLLLPVFLMALSRASAHRQAMLGATLVAFAASFGVNLWWSSSNPSLAFFMLPSRAWEMLLGGLVFLWAEPFSQRFGLSGKSRALLSALGLLMIAASAVMLDSNSAWPGSLALVPTLGAALVITAAAQENPFLSNAVLRWMGQRSYSIYLWHWPAYVAARYLGFSLDAGIILVLVALTFLLAEASYRWVEQPSLKRLNGHRLRPSLGFAAFATVAVGSAMLVRTTDGVPGRLPPQAEWAAARGSDSNPRKSCTLDKGLESPACRWGGDPGKAVSLVVVGDSHAVSVLSATAQALPQGAGPLVQWTYSGCEFMLGSAPSPSRQARMGDEYACGAFQEWVKRQVSELPLTVPLLIVNRYASHIYGGEGASVSFQGGEVQYQGEDPPRTEAASIAAAGRAIVQTACAFAPQRPVFLMRPIPEMTVNVPKALARMMMMGHGAGADVSVSRDVYERRNGWVWAAQDEAVRTCGAKIIDPTQQLCDDKRCFGFREGVVLYHDANHLSEAGNKVLVEMIKRELGRAMVGTGRETESPGRIKAASSDSQVVKF